MTVTPWVTVDGWRVTVDGGRVTVNGGRVAVLALGATVTVLTVVPSMTVVAEPLQS